MVPKNKGSVDLTTEKSQVHGSTACLGKKFA